MLRYLRIGSAYFCLTLCIFFAAFWVRSYYFQESLTVWDFGKIHSVSSWPGRIEFLRALETQFPDEVIWSYGQVSLNWAALPEEARNRLYPPAPIRLRNVLGPFVLLEFNSNAIGRVHATRKALFVSILIRSKMSFVIGVTAPAVSL